MKIAIVAAGFSPGEADKLRRAMATFRRVGTIHTFQEKMIKGMAAKGYDPAFAERCFKQIEGFGEYGFPESHAASFALLVYASCWLKCHYPDVFAAAIINSQPMGFYSPSQLVRDAKEHGVKILPPDINLATYDCTLEPETFDQRKLHQKNSEMADDIKSSHSVRLGFRQIKGIGEKEAILIDENRPSCGIYSTVRSLWLKTGLSKGAMEKLADADAFRSIGLDRRAALWQVRALDRLAKKDRMPLFDHGINAATDLQNEPTANLPLMPQSEHVIQDYRSLSLSLKAHPVSFLRGAFSMQKILPCRALEDIRNNSLIEIVGLVVVRQRPGSAKGVVFMTLEDETDIGNVIVWPKIFDQYRSIVMSARLVRVKGKLQKSDGITHLIAHSLDDATPMLAAITEQGLFAANQQGSQSTSDFDIGGLANADEVKRPIEDTRQVVNSKTKVLQLLKDKSREANIMKMPTSKSISPTQEAAKVMPKGRNFH